MDIEGFLRRIRDREAVVGVVGLGYVGLPVAVSFAEAGFQVRAVDVDEAKVTAIEQGLSPIKDVTDAMLQKVLAQGSLKVGTAYDLVADVDAVMISVPTPLREGAPDLSLIEASARSLAAVLRPGCLVVLESTTYPGTTEEILVPILEEKGLRTGTDLLVAFSPERIDSGNERFDFETIPKIVGGIDADSTEVAATLYEQVVPVVRVSGPKEAELAKLIENTFRHVNIALVNELAVYAHEMGIDIWDAIGAAATKPFGYMPFYPGPGWGGHCIPLDPAFLSWRVRQDRAHEVRFVELAHAVNSEMPRYVVERVSVLLNEQQRSLNGSRLLVVGAAYKGGIDDTRESPARKVLAGLRARGAHTDYHDPLVPEFHLADLVMRSVAPDPETIASYDLVLVLVPQEGVDWSALEDNARMILDCCNAFGKKTDKISRL